MTVALMCYIYKTLFEDLRARSSFWLKSLRNLEFDMMRFREIVTLPTHARLINQIKVKLYKLTPLTLTFYIITFYIVFFFFC